jgi:hypothetical protein
MPRHAPSLLFAVGLAAALFAAPVDARNFQPPVQWSASGGATQDVAATFGRTELAQAGDGAVVWLGTGAQGSNFGVPNLGMRVVLRPGAPPAFDQFGDEGAPIGLTLERILAADGSIALARVIENSQQSQFRRTLLVALDLVDGGLRFAVPLDANRAAVLPGGDVLAQTDDFLLRLAPDGIPRWATAFADLVERGVDAAPALQHAGSGVALVHVSRTRVQASQSLRLPDLVQAIDLGDGSPAWRVQAPTAEGRYCGTATIGDAFVLVHLGAIDANGLADAVLERRSPVDGTLLGNGAVPDLPGDDTQCRLLDIDGRAVLLAEDDQGRAVLSANGGDGALLWRNVLPDGPARSIARVPGTLDVAVLARVPNSTDERIERRRGGDGGLVWGTTLQRAGNAARRAVAATPQGVQVALLDGSSIAVTDLAPSSGAIESTTDFDPPIRRRLPYTPSFVDGVAFDAAIAGDGTIVVRRRLPTVSTGVAWSLDEPGFPAAGAEPVFAQVQAAGTANLLVLAQYRLPAGTETRRAFVVLMVDRTTGALVWRRELGDLSNNNPFFIAANGGGVLLGLTQCPPIGICSTGPTDTLKLSALDGSSVWYRELQALIGTFVGDNILVYVVEGGNQRSWRLIEGSSGTALWTQAVTSPVAPFTLEPASGGGFLAAVTPNAGGVPSVDIERRALADGAPTWVLRAGVAGDRVTSPIVRRAVNGFPLLTARRIGLESGQNGVQGPLLQLIDDSAGTPSLSLRPSLVGDRWWSLRAVAGDGQSITRQPLRSLRFLEPLDSFAETYNTRTALSFLDLATGALGGEHLVERRFDDAIIGDGGLDLIQVLPGGAIHAAESRLGPDGLRRPTLLRLGAPGDGAGDLRLRLLDADLPPTGFGPSRRVRVEVDNVGSSVASNAVFGVSVLRHPIEPVHAVFAACAVVTGSGTCPAAGTRRISLDPGATVRLEWDVHDAEYSLVVPGGRPGVAGARIFIDSPWGYADTQPGNNVVDFTLRLGAFGDDFE